MTARRAAERRGQGWLLAALLVGVAYALTGALFALPATNAHAWRIAAWIVSGAVYALHVVYEHFRLHSSSRLTAIHVAVAVAIGAVGLVTAGMLHDLRTAAAIRPSWLFALVVLPPGTAVPAFLGGLIASATLRRLRSRDQALR